MLSPRACRSARLGLAAASSREPLARPCPPAWRPKRVRRPRSATSWPWCSARNWPWRAAGRGGGSSGWSGRSRRVAVPHQQHLTEQQLRRGADQADHLLGVRAGHRDHHVVAALLLDLRAAEAGPAHPRDHDRPGLRHVRRRRRLAADRLRFLGHRGTAGQVESELDLEVVPPVARADRILADDREQHHDDEHDQSRKRPSRPGDRFPWWGHFSCVLSSTGSLSRAAEGGGDRRVRRCPGPAAHPRRPVGLSSPSWGSRRRPRAPATPPRHDRHSRARGPRARKFSLVNGGLVIGGLVIVRLGVRGRGIDVGAALVVIGGVIRLRGRSSPPGAPA